MSSHDPIAYEVHQLIELLVDRACAGATFSDVARVLRQSPGAFAGLCGLDVDRADPIRPVVSFARRLWAQIPIPRLGFCVPDLLEPKRLQACYCLSGLSYQRCCQGRQSLLDESGIRLLGFVLDCLPAERWPELAGSRVDLVDLAAVLRTWLEVRRSADVVALLTPFFGALTTQRAEHGDLLQLLLDAHGDCGNQDEFAALLDRMQHSAEPHLRAGARLRRCALHADAGDFDSAWACYAAAQREQPGHPSLATAELTVLLHQGREQEAKERAQFWELSLRRAGLGNEGLQAFLDDVVDRGVGALARWSGHEGDFIAELEELIEELPAPRNRYAEANTDDQSVGEFLALFAAVDQHSLHGLFTEDDRWLDALEANAALFDRIEVLDALQQAIYELDLKGAEPGLMVPLCSRAADIAELLATTANAAVIDALPRSAICRCLRRLQILDRARETHSIRNALGIAVPDRATARAELARDLVELQGRLAGSE